MRKVYGILVFLMLMCVGCQWQLKPASEEDADLQVSIERYDRIESLYLTTGDYSALQQMNTNFPMQTRTLIEDVLHIGKVDDEEINARLFQFFKDSTLQQMLAAVSEQYQNLDDLNEELTTAFNRLKDELSTIEVPQVYAQVGSFDQSVIVGYNTLGISLDKYLGSDYPFYQNHYSERQRQLMKREMIVPDCLSFYLLSLFPMPHDKNAAQEQRDQHMGRIQWVVNHITGRIVFTNPYVEQADQYMKNHKLTVQQLLTDVTR